LPLNVYRLPSINARPLICQRAISQAPDGESFIKSKFRGTNQSGMTKLPEDELKTKIANRNNAY